MTFRAFVGGQLGRIPQFVSFGMTETARKGIIDWVWMASGFPRDDKRQLTAPEWVAGSEAARRVYALATAVVDDEPGGDPCAAIRAAWKRLYPVKEIRKAAPDCEFCHGEGWEEVEYTSPAGQVVSGMKRCRCGGMPQGNGQ
jgi:hypothetical protein